MSIQASLREFGTALRSLEGQYNVYHYWRPQMATPFIVWAETGELMLCTVTTARARC